MMKKSAIRPGVTTAMLLSLMLLLAACGGDKAKTPDYTNLKDGTYSGRSSDYEADESGNGAGYGEVTIEISGGRITSCEFKMYELDGKLKDETYGSDLSQENRLKAQKAVQSADKYASMLVEKGELSGVDTISGATISFNEFNEAVNDALSQAAQ